MENNPIDDENLSDAVREQAHLLIMQMVARRLAAELVKAANPENEVPSRREFGRLAAWAMCKLADAQEVVAPTSSKGAELLMAANKAQGIAQALVTVHNLTYEELDAINEEEAGELARQANLKKAEVV